MDERKIDGLVISKTVTVDYVGQTENGVPNGWGKAYFNNGSMYDGEWKDGKMHGKAKELYTDGTLQYEGYYKDGYRDGRGKSFNTNGTVNYDGEWKQGKKVDAPNTATNWA